LTRKPEETVRRVRERFRIPSRFVLVVGRVERRKNPVHVLRSFARATAAPGLSDVSLVFAGAYGNAAEEVRAAARGLGVEDRLVFCGYVSEELAALYQAAELLVYASLYEGFGHPPFEAISLGTPVVASGIPVLREVLDSGGLLVPPCDENALADAIRRVLRHPDFRSELLARGRERLAEFSWSNAAERIAALHWELNSRFRGSGLARSPSLR
jgi:glycosyltransferase involved in cell wall biosynthesis